MDLTGLLGTTTAHLQDILDWKPGTKLMLPTKPNDTINLLCGNILVGKGYMGNRNGNISVQLDKIFLKDGGKKMNATMIFDFLLVALLSAILIYAVILNRRLRTLYANRKEITSFFQRFSEALLKAQKSVSNLQDTTSAMVMELNEKIREARALRDELAFFMERGDNSQAAWTSTFVMYKMKR